MAFGEKLKETREKMGWTRRWLARKIGYHEQSVYRWETSTDPREGTQKHILDIIKGLIENGLEEQE